MNTIHRFMKSLSQRWMRYVSKRFDGIAGELVQIIGPIALLSAFLLFLCFVMMLINRKRRGAASRFFSILFGFGAIAAAVVWAFFWVEEYSTIINRHTTLAVASIAVVAVLAILFMCLTRGKKSAATV